MEDRRKIQTSESERERGEEDEKTNSLFFRENCFLSLSSSLYMYSYCFNWRTF